MATDWPSGADVMVMTLSVYWPSWRWLCWYTGQAEFAGLWSDTGSRANA